MTAKSAILANHPLTRQTFFFSTLTREKYQKKALFAHKKVLNFHWGYIFQWNLVRFIEEAQNWKPRNFIKKPAANFLPTTTDIKPSFWCPCHASLAPSTHKYYFNAAIFDQTIKAWHCQRKFFSLITKSKEHQFSRTLTHLSQTMQPPLGGCIYIEIKTIYLFLFFSA